MRALLVDSEPEVRGLLSKVLRRRAGFTTTDADNGIAALQWLGRDRFDLVVLDLFTSPMGGLETLEVMRRTPALRQIPVVVMSEAREESLVRQVARLGVAGFLLKPLHPVDVSERFHDILLRIGTPAGADDAAASVRDALAFRPDLRPALATATTQVIGLGHGLGLTQTDVDHAPQPGDDIAWIRLVGDADAHEDLELVLTAPRATTRRMTSAALRDGQEAGEEAAQALGDSAVRIASRLCRVLRQRGDTVSLGDVAIGVVDPAEAEDARGLQVSFDMAGAGRLRATVRAVPTMGESDVPVRPEVPPIDRAALDMLDSLREPGQPDILQEIVGLFLTDTPGRLEELRAPSIQPADVARVAHSIKGAAGNVGATYLHQLLGELEAAARERRDVLLPRLTQAVEQEYARVDQELRAIIASRSGD